MKGLEVYHVQRIMKPQTASQQFIVGNDDERGDITEFDEPFEPGDYVSIVTPHIILTGKVLTTESGSTKLKTVWGNIIIVPPSLIASATIINHCVEKRYSHASVKCAVQNEV